MQPVNQGEPALQPASKVDAANASLRYTFINMSVTTGALEAAREDQAARSSMFTTIKNYFVAAGLPTSSLLTQHAAEHHHEDVPDEVAKEAEGTPPPFFSTKFFVAFTTIVTLDRVMVGSG